MSALKLGGTGPGFGVRGWPFGTYAPLAVRLFGCAIVGGGLPTFTRRERAQLRQSATFKLRAASPANLSARCRVTPNARSLAARNLGSPTRRTPVGVDRPQTAQSRGRGTAGSSSDRRTLGARRPGSRRDGLGADSAGLTLKSSPTPTVGRDGPHGGQGERVAASLAIAARSPSPFPGGALPRVAGRGA